MRLRANILWMLLGVVFGVVGMVFALALVVNQRDRCQARLQEPQVECICSCDGDAAVLEVRPRGAEE